MLRLNSKYLFSEVETKKHIQTQTYIEEIDHGFDQDIQVIEREDSNNVSIQINIKPKPTMKNNSRNFVNDNDHVRADIIRLADD